MRTALIPFTSCPATPASVSLSLGRMAGMGWLPPFIPTRAGGLLSLCLFDAVCTAIFAHRLAALSPQHRDRGS